MNWYSSCHRDCELVTLPKITNTWFIFTSWHSVYKMLSTNVTLTTCNLSSVWKSIYTVRKLRVYCFTNVQALTLTCKCWCFIDLNTFRDSLYHLQLITVDLWSLSEKQHINQGQQQHLKQSINAHSGYGTIGNIHVLSMKMKRIYIILTGNTLHG